MYGLYQGPCPFLSPICALHYRLACTRRTKIQVYQGDICGSGVGSSRHCFRNMGDHLPEYGEGLHGGGAFGIDDLQDDIDVMQLPQLHMGDLAL